MTRAHPYIHIQGRYVLRYVCVFKAKTRTDLNSSAQVCILLGGVGVYIAEPENKEELV